MKSRINLNETIFIFSFIVNKIDNRDQSFMSPLKKHKTNAMMTTPTKRVPFGDISGVIDIYIFLGLKENQSM